MKNIHFLKESYPICLTLLLCLLVTSCQNKSKTNKEAIHSISIDGLELEEIDIPSLQEKYNSGEINAQQVVAYYLDRIEKLDKSGPSLNSIIHVNPYAMEKAREVDKERKEGIDKGMMHGVPVIVKDNIDTGNMPTTAGSLALEGSVPLEDSPVVKNLKEAGAIILGKANLSEWANFRGQKSTSGWSGLGGLSKNPYVLIKNTCGSSAGSAVAVAANLCMVAVGTETNGSIVCPSQTNCLIGIKPSLNIVPTKGVIPISKTQDVVGPMARTVMDAAICLNAMVEKENISSYGAGTFPRSYKDYTMFLTKNGFKEKRIGLWKGSMGFDPAVDALMKKAVEALENSGATIIELEQVTEDIGNASFQLMLYEYKEGLNAYFESLGPNAKIKSVEELIAFNKENPEELKYFGQEYLEMAQEKGDTKSDEYRQAKIKMIQGVRTNGIDKVMKEHKLHAIIAPTGSPAWDTDLENGDTYKGGSSSPAAQAGYPNITVPLGFVGELPVGISFFGRAYSEPLLLEIAYNYEQLTKHRKRPKYLEGE